MISQLFFSIPSAGRTTMEDGQRTMDVPRLSSLVPRTCLRITHKMFFPFFAQEINIAKDILVKPAVARMASARARQDGSGTTINPFLGVLSNVLSKVDIDHGSRGIGTLRQPERIASAEKRPFRDYRTAGS